MNNLEIYNMVREVPQTALKTINAGRLKGMSDINPMWRIKSLTEVFGACGIGWKYEITRQWMSNPAPNGEVACFCNIMLYYKHDGEWSEGIPGTGGSSFLAQQKNGMYLSDECFKMALTDAISVACKALGFGADVYWNKDETKYSINTQPLKEYKCVVCGKPFEAFTDRNGKTWSAGQVYHMSESKNGRPVCKACAQKK